MREYKLSEYIPDKYNNTGLALSYIITKYYGYEISSECTGPVNNFINLNRTDIFRVIETRTRSKGLLSRSAAASIKLEYYALIDDDEWEGTSIYFGNRSNYSQNKVNEKYRKYRLLKKRW